MTDQLRQLLDAAAPPPTKKLSLDGLLREARERRGRRRRLGGVAVAVLALVAVAGATLAVAWPGSPEGDREASLIPATSPAPASPGSLSVPAGSQAISFHGLQLYVPAGWKRGDAYCGVPQTNTVIIEDDGPVNSCLPRPRNGLTVVWLTRLSGVPGQRYASHANTVEDLGGLTARTGYLPGGTARGTGGRYLLVVPARDAVVSVSAPTAAQAEAILRTARPANVDAFGCPARSSLTGSVSPGLVDAAKDRLIPGRPTTATVCTYSRGWLAYAGRTAAGPLVGVLNALPAGSLPPSDNPTSSFCRMTDAQGKAITLKLSYADGSEVTLVVRYAACTRASITNGVRESKTSPAVLSLIPADGYDVGAVTLGR
jgi:hypothetical protein